MYQGSTRICYICYIYIPFLSMFDLDDLSPAGPSGSARPSPCWVLPGGVHSAPWERLGNRCRARMDRDGFLEFDERNYEIMENHGKSWKPEVENPHILPIQMAIYCWRTHLSRDRPRYCRNGLNLAGQLRVRPPPSVRWSVSSWSWLQLHIASRLVCKNVMCLSHLNRPLAFLGPSKPHRKCLTV